MVQVKIAYTIKTQNDQFDEAETKNQAQQTKHLIERLETDNFVGGW